MRHRLALVGMAWLAACGGRASSRAESGGRIAEAELAAGSGTSAGTLVEVSAATNATAGIAQPAKPYANAEARGLAHAAGGVDGRRYVERPAAVPGVIVGVVKGGSPRDTSITPTHDLSVCKPFTEAQVPSRQGGVGNAVVWLEGVTEGPKDDAPRRVKLTLDGCHLEPRVQRVAAGGTVLVNSRDAMMSRLQFLAAGETVSRATILLTDAGQIVPTSDVTRPPALVEVRDDRHPWVRGWLAVAPHPFLAVTQADGQFRFDNVPPGKYTLVVWQEKLGARKTTVRVEAGVQAGVEVTY